MKTIKSRFGMALLLAAVGISSAYAQGSMPAQPMDRAQMMEKMQKRMQERMDKHRTMMHDHLKITADQEQAWKVFTEATAHNASQLIGQHQGQKGDKAMEGMSAPAAMEKQLERSKEHIALMQKHLEALKTFYAVLSPEQQKTFDHMHKRMHHRMQMVRHLGMMEHGRQGRGHDMDQHMGQDPQKK